MASRLSQASSDGVLRNWLRRYLAERAWQGRKYWPWLALSSYCDRNVALQLFVLGCRNLQNSNDQPDGDDEGCADQEVTENPFESVEAEIVDFFDEALNAVEDV